MHRRKVVAAGGVALTAFGFGLAFLLIYVVARMFPDAGPGGIKCQWIWLDFATFLIPLTTILAWIGWLGLEILLLRQRMFERLTWIILSALLVVSLAADVSINVLAPECPFPTR